MFYLFIIFPFFVVYTFIDPSLFYLAFSAMLLSFALGHFSSFDGITSPLNFSIKKLFNLVSYKCRRWRSIVYGIFFACQNTLLGNAIYSRCVCWSIQIGKLYINTLSQRNHEVSRNWNVLRLLTVKHASYS